MDTSALVADEIAAGREALSRLNETHPIRTACWVQEDEDAGRYLFVLLGDSTFEQIDAARRELRRIANEMDPYFDPFRVKVIGPSHPVAISALKIYQAYFPRKVPTRIDNLMFGARAVGDVYLYPPFAPLA